LDFKRLFDLYTICGHGKVQGKPIGIIGNNGPITPQGAVKAAQFIQLCSTNQLPVVFLQNTTGFMVGKTAETLGAIKHGSKLIQAVANMSSPKIAIVVGASYGAGNYAMCSRAMKPDFIFAWPNAKQCVMGGQQAATVLSLITEAKFKRKKQSVPVDFLQGMSQQVIAEFDLISQPLYCSARIFDDGLIDPRDTRNVLALVLHITTTATYRRNKPGQTSTFGIARL
jgi:geranyl-CoA carboxylase beta subunit